MSVPIGRTSEKKILKFCYVLFCLCVVIKFILRFIEIDVFKVFWRMSLPRKFIVLCFTTRISQLVADEFPDEMLIIKMLFMFIFLLLKHLNSPTLFAFCCKCFPSFDASNFAFAYDTKLPGLPVTTSQCISISLFLVYFY